MAEARTAMGRGEVLWKLCGRLADHSNACKPYNALWCKQRTLRRSASHTKPLTIMTMETLQKTCGPLKRLYGVLPHVTVQVAHAVAECITDSRKRQNLSTSPIVRLINKSPQQTDSMCITCLYPQTAYHRNHWTPKLSVLLGACTVHPHLLRQCLGRPYSLTTLSDNFIAPPLPHNDLSNFPLVAMEHPKLTTKI